MKKTDWHFDEFIHRGTNYASPAVAAVYDGQLLGTGRDVDADNASILEAVGLKTGESLVDMGCGTGCLAVHAASMCAHVFAVDVSEAMIELAKGKIQQAGVGNVSFHNAGFLTYEHVGAPVDVVVTQKSLHHLPDFWKFVALVRMRNMIRQGGRLYIKDFILSFDAEHYCEHIPAILNRMDSATKSKMALHFREEFSTYYWILEEMITKAGFAIKLRQYEDGFVGKLLCVKL